MALEVAIQQAEVRDYWTIRRRTNALVLAVAAALVFMAAALVHQAHNRIIVAVALGVLLLYLVAVPLYLRNVFRLMQLNNRAALQLTRGDTDLPPLPVKRRDEFGQMARALLRMRDLTEDLRHKSQIDTLTGLSNRDGLEIALDTALDDARERVGTVALLLLDLKRFRHLNHAFGIETGDRALKHAAACLREALPEATGIARLQADRFAMALSLPDEPLTAHHAAISAVTTLRERLGLAQVIDGHVLTLDACVGVALYPHDGKDVRNLLIAAEAALALARRDGSESLRFADPELAQHAQRTANTISEIRKGLLAGEFLPHYEPIVDLGTGDVRGAEALARWSHPYRGMVSPAEFIPVAEELGLIESLTSALLPMICADAAAWKASGTPRCISVNLSARELNEGFVERLAAAIRYAGLDPKRMTVELTETAMVERPEKALEVLRAIKALGVMLSLDDFGTGFSSLSYLQRFPIDNVKIDRSFVAELPDSPRAKQLVEAILSMARALNLGVVAEGVETIEQARMLAEMGCLRQQGYLYARALSAAHLSDRLGEIQGQLDTLRVNPV